MIYFMQPVQGGPIKIGSSVCVARRREQLEAFYGCKLRILAVREGDKEREREIHEQFSDLRFDRTDQFRPGAEIYEFLGLPFPGDQQVERMPGDLDRVHRPARTNFRCHEAWKEWATEFAVEEGCDLVDLVEEAFLMLAHKKGFKMPPAR